MNEVHEYHEYSEVVPGPPTTSVVEYRVVESVPVLPQYEQVQQVQQVQTVRTIVTRDSGLRRLTLMIFYFFGLLESLLFIRFILGLMGANANSPFAVLLRGITLPFLFLFEGLLPTPRAGSSVMEFSTLVAIVMYALLAFAIVRLVRLVYARSPA
jgi:uncharacterized protein YggT (Ycf19 family)